jgi:type II secretion system protein N
MTKRLFKIAGWTFLWLIFFWTFLVIGFPKESARDWLAGRLEREINARVSIEELTVMWNLGVKLNGISVEKSGENGFLLKIDSLKVRPRLLSLIGLRPIIDFMAYTPSGGDFSGLYKNGMIEIAFSEVPFKDIGIASIPAPSAATASGSASLKMTGAEGKIETEVGGLPGGRQRAVLKGSGVEGSLKVKVTLPKL